MFISWMLITLSFKKSLIVEEFQGNYLKIITQRELFELIDDPLETNISTLFGFLKTFMCFFNLDKGILMYA